MLSKSIIGPTFLHPKMVNDIKDVQPYFCYYIPLLMNNEINKCNGIHFINPLFIYLTRCSVFFELSHFTPGHCYSDRRINDLYVMPGKISYIYKLYLSNLTHISKDVSGFTTLYVEKLSICAPKECFIYVCINQVASNSICPLTRFTKAKAHVLSLQSY